MGMRWERDISLCESLLADTLKVCLQLLNLGLRYVLNDCPK